MHFNTKHFLSIDILRRKRILVAFPTRSDQHAHTTIHFRGDDVLEVSWSCNEQVARSLLAGK